MLPSDERRLRVEEAQERREHWLRWELPLIPEDARPPILEPTAADLRRMEQELKDKIWERRKRRGDWTE